MGGLPKPLKGEKRLPTPPSALGDVFRTAAVFSATTAPVYKASIWKHSLIV